MLAQKRANATRQNNLIYKPNQLVLFSEATKQTDAVLTPHIVLKITSPRCTDCVRDVNQCRGCEIKPSTAIQIQCLHTGKKRVTDKSNLYPLLGSDYISPKLLQYVTQLHSRAKQDTITQMLEDETADHNNPIQPDNSTTELANIDQTLPSSNNVQNPLTQDFPAEDPELLSPDPAREVILRHSQNSQITQPVKNNNTTIQEEWIIPDEILPDETWNPDTNSKTQNTTQSTHDINIAQKCKSILKTTTPITSNIIDHSQKKAYHAASHLAQQLGYKSAIQHETRQYLNTKEYIEQLQPFKPQKASHNRKIAFQIPDTKKPHHPPAILTEHHLIFSVIECISFKESFLRSSTPNKIL